MTQGNPRHSNLLTWIYIDNTTISMAKERRTLLFGARARETTEDLNERQIRKEIRAVLPQVFGGLPSGSESGVSDLHTSCPTFLSATCHEQFKMLKVWLHPILRKHITESSVLLSSRPHVTDSPTVTPEVALMTHPRTKGSLSYTAPRSN